MTPGFVMPLGSSARLPQRTETRRLVRPLGAPGEGADHFADALRIPAHAGWIAIHLEQEQGLDPRQRYSWPIQVDRLYAALVQDLDGRGANARGEHGLD